MAVGGILLCLIFTIEIHNVMLDNSCILPPGEKDNVPGFTLVGDGTVEFNLMYKHGTFDEHHERTFELHYKIIFNYIRSKQSLSSYCLGLRSVVIEGSRYLDDKYTAYRYVNFSTIVEHVQYSFLKVKFNSETPAGIMNIKFIHDYHVEMKLSVFCNITKVPEGSDLFPQWYTNGEYEAFGGHDTEVHIDFDKKVLASQVELLLRNMKNIVRLRLTGVLWMLFDLPSLENFADTLKHLDISDNEIVDIETFPYMKVLEVLILAKNKLRHVPKGISNCTMLRHLDMSHNDFFSNSSFQTIRNLRDLKTLNIAFNNIEKLEFFRKCDTEFQLEVLNISYCDIQFLHKDDLVYLKQLKVIDLSHNKLRTIPSEFLKGQIKLFAVNISNNLIYESPKFIFSTNNITSLDLSNNKLSSVDIITDGHTDFLNLSGNIISKWTSEIIFEEHVLKLDLSHNFIKAVSKEMIKSFETLKSVDLGNNIFNCSDCTLPEFQNWINGTNHKRPRIYNLGTAEDLTCILHNYCIKNITKLHFNNPLCVIHYINYGMVCGVPVLVLVVVTIFTIFCCRLYRFEITYIVRLINIKRNNEKRLTSGKYNYDAFVCYSGHDRTWVIGNLLPVLKSEPEKYRLCLHERDFALGSIITHNIVHSIDSSRHAIVVLTNNFVKNQWCQWELEMANHKRFEDSREFLIIIELEQLDRSSLPRHLKYLMDTRTYLEWPKSNENCEIIWRKLKDALGPSIHSRHVAKTEEEIPLEHSSHVDKIGEEVPLQESFGYI